MDGRNSQKYNRSASPQEAREDGFRHIRQRLLSNLSAMSRAEGRRLKTTRREVPGGPILGYHLSGAASGWGETSPHGLHPEGEIKGSEPQTFRLSDWSAWQLSGNAESSAFDRLLQEDGQRTPSHWYIAGGIPEQIKVGFCSFEDPGGRITALCQRCFSRVPLDELTEATSIQAVGTKRKREEQEIAMAGACRACRSRSCRADDIPMAQQEHQEGTSVQASPAGDRGTSQSSEEHPGNGIAEAFGYYDDADTGGLFRRLGGSGVRPGGVRRVDIRSAQSAIPELLPGRIDDEREDQRRAKEEESECSDPPSDQQVAGRELRTSEDFTNDEADLSFPSSVGSSESTDPDPFDYMFANWLTGDPNDGSDWDFNYQQYSYPSDLYDDDTDFS